MHVNTDALISFQMHYIRNIPHNRGFKKSWRNWRSWRNSEKLGSFMTYEEIQKPSEMICKINNRKEI